MITIYRNLFDMQPNYITVEKALERIKTGKSKEAVNSLRNMVDKVRAEELKKNLPSVCFSGKIVGKRLDTNIKEYSGYVVLDFDYLFDVRDFQEDIINHDYVYACWISPSGNGLKALVKIAQPEKHREHFQALKDVFPLADKSGINESRVCFESYDPDIYINENAKAFTKLKTVEKIQQTVVQSSNQSFNNILRWLANRGDSFVSGERNRFIFLLASACCRYGIDMFFAETEILNKFPCSNDFTKNEAINTIKSAYKSNSSLYGSAVFEKEVLITKEKRTEVVIDAAVFDQQVKPKDVIFGEDVKQDAVDIFNNGFEELKGIGIDEIDHRWKFKKGELNCLTGIGNYGKSTFMKWYLIIRALMYGEKCALFAPEDNPAHEFYHECTEILMGTSLLPSNPNKPNFEHFNAAYDFISNHFFFIHPKEKTPTPAFVKERFLELIIKNGVNTCIIDPFNQMTNDYASHGGRTDKYLEYVLSDLTMFAKENAVNFMIVAHPHKMQKDSTGNYPCPDVFDLADGAMWNNKMDNILVYHRTNHQTNPDGSECEFHSKKIRRQRIVGKKGFSLFQYDRMKRRYLFNGLDPIQKYASENNITYAHLYKDYIKPITKQLPKKPEMWYDDTTTDGFDGF